MDNNNTEGIEKLQFKQIKNKRRSKTPLRKKSLYMAGSINQKKKNNNDDETNLQQQQQHQSIEKIIETTRNPGIKYNKKMWLKHIATIVPLLYTIIFVLGSYNAFVEHIFYKNRHHNSKYFSRSLKTITSYFDVPIGWGVFARPPRQNESPLALSQTNHQGFLIGKICATDLNNMAAAASSSSDDENNNNNNNNTKCDWVDLYPALVDIGFRETIFHSLRPLLPGLLMNYLMTFMNFLTDLYHFDIMINDSKDGSMHKKSIIAQPYGRRLQYPSFTFARNAGSSFWHALVQKKYKEMKLSRYLCTQWNATNIYNDNRYAYNMKIVKIGNQRRQLWFDKNYNFIQSSDPCKYTSGFVRSEFDCEKNEFITTTKYFKNQQCLLGNTCYII